jgi:hypothetical protein
MSDAGDISIISDGDVDMAGGDSDSDGSDTERARPAIQQAKGPQKTASEMYTKVSFFLSRTRRHADP